MVCRYSSYVSNKIKDQGSRFSRIYPETSPKLLDDICSTVRHTHKGNEINIWYINTFIEHFYR